MKKTVKRFMSAFAALALVLCLGMSLGGVPAYAAEMEDLLITETVAEEEAVQQQSDSSWTTVLSTYFKFYNYVDTVSKYYSGNNISVALSGIHSDGEGTFRIYVYQSNSSGQIVNSTPVSYSSIYDSNNCNATISWGDMGPGYYIFRVQKLSGSARQYIDSATFYTY